MCVQRDLMIEELFSTEKEDTCSLRGRGFLVIYNGSSHCVSGSMLGSNRDLFYTNASEVSEKRF